MVSRKLGWLFFSHLLGGLHLHKSLVHIPWVILLCPLDANISVASGTVCVEIRPLTLGTISLLTSHYSHFGQLLNMVDHIGQLTWQKMDNVTKISYQWWEIGVQTMKIMTLRNFITFLATLIFVNSNYMLFFYTRVFSFYSLHVVGHIKLVVCFLPSLHNIEIIGM